MDPSVRKSRCAQRVAQVYELLADVHAEEERFEEAIADYGRVRPTHSTKPLV